ncbi:MAG: UvrD-helicase domain-containing protein, partial [Candidatus Methylacidiphilales bacterium]
MTASDLSATAEPETPATAVADHGEAPRPPADQGERDRFIGQLAHNFSVIAPAGVGKTRSIVERIAAITAAPNAAEVLPWLVVVTYTDRAAREMKRRARQRVLQLQQATLRGDTDANANANAQTDVDLDVDIDFDAHGDEEDGGGAARHSISAATMAAFNQAFFGTIHSLCVKLLQTHGHFLGVPARFEVADEDRLDELWDEFISNDVPWNRSLSDADRDALLRHVGLLDLFRLSREVRLPLPEKLEEPGPLPEVPLLGILTELRGMIAKAKNPAASVTNTLEAVERFERQMSRPHSQSRQPGLTAQSGQPDKIAAAIAKDGPVLGTDDMDQPLPGEVFCPLPERLTEAKAIREMWEDSFRPLRDWLSRAATRAAVEIAEAFRQFRIAQGVLTFDDQIALALELLETPEVAERVLQKPWRIILDEAQDTDPIQFQVLLRLAQRLDPTGNASTMGASRTLPGRFSMVGDFQQSIYGQRADIPTYRQHHQDLLKPEHGAEAMFTVTFRCSRAVVDFVNGVFPHAFASSDDKAGEAAGNSAAAAALGEQARFVKLQAASTAAQGRTFRVPLPPLPEDDGIGAAEPGSAAAGLPGAALPFAPRRRRRQTREIETHIAEHVAHVMATQGLDGLQASRWSEVAVLCPRIAWLHPLRKALAARGIDSQNLSTHDIVGDHPARAWFTSLAWIMAEPLSGYEIVGVLRDIFGISDHALAVFSDGDGARFQIARPTEVLERYADEELPAHQPAPTASTTRSPGRSAQASTATAPPTTARTVAQTLRFLAQLREEMGAMAVRTAAQHMAVSTRLLER